MFSPVVIVVLHLVLAALLVAWLVRERRMGSQRRALRTLYTLGESLIGAASPQEILKKVAAVLQDVLGVTGAALYVYNRRTRRLDGVAAGPDSEPVSIDPDAPEGTVAPGVALAFRNRTLLTMPDTHRSPLLVETGSAGPRAVLFVPMFVQNDLLGVLEVEHRGKARRFTSEEQAVAQHLANQIAATLKRSEQQSMQEQLFRTEKLAAAGQVISSVAGDLGGPIAAISQLAEALLARQPAPPERAQLEAIQAEVRQASGIVARLVQLADVEAAEVGPMDLNELLNGVMALHKRNWAAASLEVQNLCSQEPIPVVGSAGQLEQVFSTLLAYAENSAAESSAKTFTVTSKMLARRAVVEITCPAPGSAGEAADPFSDGETVRNGLLGLGMCRGIVRNHGGELRFRRLAPDQPRFEIELPAAPARAEEGPEDQDGATRPGKTLTALVVEPETPVERQLLLLLSQRGHRVVPVSSAEEALDLVQRLRFDLVCCSVRLPGLNWVEFSQRVRHQTGAFVLLTEGFDAELAQALQGDEGYLLSKPVQPAEFERIIGLVEAKA